LLDVDTTWDPRAVGAPQYSSVVGRHIFYNQSAYDGNNEQIDANSDEAARAADKSPYLPNGTTASFESISSFSKGITGVMIDLSSEWNHAGLTLANAANNFVFKVGNNNAPGTWALAPTPTAISMISGGGSSGSDRVEITWATGAIRNLWLEVQVLATPQTGLAAPDVFYWGSRVADSGTSPSAATFETTTTDAAQVFASLGTNQPITELRDYNRDGSVTTTDAALVFANLGSLARIAIDAAEPFSPLGAAFGAVVTLMPQSQSPSVLPSTTPTGNLIAASAAARLRHRSIPWHAEPITATTLRPAPFIASTGKARSLVLHSRLDHMVNQDTEMAASSWALGRKREIAIQTG
jgi:hypothetical protein